MVLVIHWAEFEIPIYNAIHNCATPSFAPAMGTLLIRMSGLGSS
jgi:hypothetical protein